MSVNTRPEYPECPAIYQPGTIISSDFGITVNAVPIMEDNDLIHKTKYHFTGLIVEYLLQTYSQDEIDQILKSQSLRLRELLNLQQPFIETKKRCEFGGRLGQTKLLSSSFLRDASLNLKLEQYQVVFDRYVLVNGVMLLQHKVVVINSRENHNPQYLAAQLRELDDALVNRNINAEQMIGLQKIVIYDGKSIEELVQESSSLAQTIFNSQKEESRVYSGCVIKTHQQIDTMINAFKLVLHP